MITIGVSNVKDEMYEIKKKYKKIIVLIWTQAKLGQNTFQTVFLIQLN